MARTVKHKRDDVAGPDLVIAFYWAVVDMYKTCIGSLLYAVSRRMLQFFGHELVHSDRLLMWVCHKAEVLIELSLLVIGKFFQEVGRFVFHYGISTKSSMSLLTSENPSPSSVL